MSALSVGSLKLAVDIELMYMNNKEMVCIIIDIFEYLFKVLNQDLGLGRHVKCGPWP